MKPAAADKLELIFKRLWGASTIPFCAGAQPAFEHPAFEAVTAKLGQLCAIGASGVLHGPNGVGKSYLFHHLLSAKLSDKAFKTVTLTHSSLSGSDLLRALCLALELRPQFRRSDNVAAITEAWKTLGSRWPVLMVEEAREALVGRTGRTALAGVRQARGGPFQLGADRRSLLAGEVTAGHSRATAQSAGLLLAPGSPGCSSESSVRRARPAQRQQASTPTLSSPKRSNC